MKQTKAAEQIDGQYYSNKKERRKNGVCSIANCGLPIHIYENGKKSNRCSGHKNEKAQREKKKQEERKKNRVCRIASCGLPVTSNKDGTKAVYCTSHRIKNAQRAGEKYEERKNAGLCAKCDSLLVSLGFCEYHLKKRSSLEARFKQGKRDARKLNLEWITLEEYITLNPIQCHYCLESIAETCGHGLDRKNTAIKSYRDNCVPCCWECNRSKGSDISYEEMLVLAEGGRGAMNEFRDRKKEVQDAIFNKILTQRKKEGPEATRKRIRKNLDMMFSLS